MTPAKRTTTGAHRAERARTTRRRQRGQPVETHPVRAVMPVDVVDRWVAAGTGLVTAAVYLTTLSSHVALGDAPETAAGVRSLGILHAPGYALYVVAARIFGEIVRVGSWELRVNLFSLVCASLTTAGVYMLARRLGAERMGAVLGALALAFSVSFWFNAGFAKYYACSALLVTLIALCVMVWLERGRTSWLVVAAALSGASIGVSWQLAVIMVAGLAVLLWTHRPRPSVRALVTTAISGTATLIATSAYIMVRAAQDPTLNYGRATGIGRLVRLLTTADFAGSRQAAGAGAAHLAHGAPDYLGIIARDVGLGAVVFAVVGIVDVCMRRRLDHGLFFSIVGVGNIVAIGLVAGIDTISGFYTSLVMGGQFSDVLIVVAILTALGASRAGHEVQVFAARTRTAGASAGSPARVLVVAATAVMALVIVVPSLVVHYDNANHRTPPLGDEYAQQVLAALPPNSVLLAGAWELGGPIVKRQELYGERHDVSVVSADTIAYDWYRETLVKKLHLDRSLLNTTSENTVTRFVAALRAQRRPVYTDALGMYYGRSLFGYQAAGLVGRVVDGTGPQPDPDRAKIAADLRGTENRGALESRRYLQFPNLALYFLHERAHVEIAKQYALADDLGGAANELERAFEFGRPGEDHSALDAARAHSPDAKQMILNL